jgi:hypothetical protein
MQVILPEPYCIHTLHMPKHTRGLKDCSLVHGPPRNLRACNVLTEMQIYIYPSTAAELVGTKTETAQKYFVKLWNIKFHENLSSGSRAVPHPNDLIVNLIELPDNRRLRTHLPNDLPTNS